ncbi:MAG: molybdenum cofactor biosynthesis protein MoaE [Gemmatimonadetes bacterium]|nr:molybdenum cofactor biosynthesis protein MoaE [Gemmatimonadota bacterium]
MRVELTAEPIRVADVLEGVGVPEDGAVVLFLGIVRDRSEGRPVTGVRYDAYRAMAERVLEEIAGDAVRRLGTDRLVVVHRVGALAVGEISVAIAASSPHRAEAFEACRLVIEEIKLRLPVWKQECDSDGEARWVPGHEPEAPRSSGMSRR